MDNKKSMEDEAKKLTLLVVFMSVFVFILYGLGPMI